MRKARQSQNERSDRELLDACLAGDEMAWQAMVERYERLIYSIALRSGLPEADAADVLQTVFIIVLRRLETLRDSDRFSAWLITTTQRECWRVRNGRQSERLDDVAEPVDPDVAYDDLVIAWEEAQLVHDALGRIGDQCRKLIEMLFLWDDRPSYQVVSAELGIAVGSIGPVRARCLKRLRTQLKSLGITEPTV